MSNSRGGTCAPILGSAGLVNPPKLLLDENLSPSIAVTLTREGYDVVHVRDRRLLKAPDAQVFARAFDEDRIGWMRRTRSIRFRERSWFRSVCRTAGIVMTPSRGSDGQVNEGGTAVRN